jgi:cyclohexyl-isocyanide hydratase
MKQTEQRAFQIGMIIFEGMTNLDFAGPHDIFARLPNTVVHVMAKENEPIITDVGGRVLPSIALAEAPQLDLIFIGGGPGTTALLEDDAMLEFLSRQAEKAQWVTSVCTGALVLGAAGLLRGYKAATHWTAMEVLKPLGAEPVHTRVVIDRNRITGGGVTAGIDFGLTIAALLHGPGLAQAMQLGMEYDPAPPYQSGSPELAPPDILERVLQGTSKLTATRMEAAESVARKNGWV